MREPTPLDFDAVCRTLEQHDREPAQVRLAFVRGVRETGINPMPFGLATGLLRMLTQDEIDVPADLLVGVAQPGQRDCAFIIGTTRLGFTSVDFVQGALEESGILSFQTGAVVLSFNFDVADFRERGSHGV